MCARGPCAGQFGHASRWASPCEDLARTIGHTRGRRAVLRRGSHGPVLNLAFAPHDFESRIRLAEQSTEWNEWSAAPGADRFDERCSPARRDRRLSALRAPPPPRRFPLRRPTQRTNSAGHLSWRRASVVAIFQCPTSSGSSGWATRTASTRTAVHALGAVDLDRSQPLKSTWASSWLGGLRRRPDQDGGPASGSPGH
jgi:hypothetical protein